MTVEYLTRASWTDTDAAGGTFTRPPIGVALHWPGTPTSYRSASADRIRLALAGFRRHHVATNGWADVAYQVAIDQAGRVWDLRGIGRKSAANGDATTNGRHGAVLLMLGPGDTVTPAMGHAFATWRLDRWLARWPDADDVTTHDRVRPSGTTCPGPAARSYVDGRTWDQVHAVPPPAPTPPPKEEDDEMATKPKLYRAPGRPRLLIAGEDYAVEVQPHDELLAVEEHGDPLAVNDLQYDERANRAARVRDYRLGRA